YLIGQLFQQQVAWRWMLGIEALPALIFSLLVARLPNSPRWLVMKGREDTLVIRSMSLLGIARDRALLQLEEIKITLRERVDKQRESLFSGKYNKSLMLAFFIAFFNQLSGINFILYYAPEILERAGFGSGESLLSSISIGLVNLIFTFVGISLIDRMGRKQLMVIGSLGYILSLSMVAWCFHSAASPTLLLIFILLF